MWSTPPSDSLLEIGYTIGGGVAEGFKLFDKYVVTGASDLTGSLFKRAGEWVRELQTGQVQNYLLTGIALAAVLVAKPAAGAGVHGSHELKACGEVGALGGTGDADVAGFQRLAQGFEHASVKFGEFVKKQYAVVRQRDFTGARHAAAADQSRAGGRVVRRAIRTLPPLFRAKTSGQ